MTVADMTVRFAAFLLVAVLALNGASASESSRTVQVENAWARVTPSDKTTANVYVEIANHSAVADELTSIWSPYAETAAVMRPHWRGLKMTMERVRILGIEPGKSLIMRPGDYQITLSGLTHPFHPGQTIPLELHFRRAGRIEFSAVVSNKLIADRKAEEAASN